MPSPSQYNTAAAQRIAPLKPEGAVWYWKGWVKGQEGQVGNVEDPQGRRAQGRVIGDSQPRLDAAVAFIPGNPIGIITIASVPPIQGRLPDIAAETTERAIGIPGPVVNNVYGIIPWAEAQYVAVSFTISNRTETGGSATAGTGTLLVNGNAVTLGVTVIEPADFVGVRVDAVGTGIYYATVVVRGG